MESCPTLKTTIAYRSGSRRSQLPEVTRRHQTSGGFWVTQLDRIVSNGGPWCPDLSQGIVKAEKPRVEDVGVSGMVGIFSD